MYYYFDTDGGYSIEVIHDRGFTYHQFEKTKDFNDCKYLPSWSLGVLLNLMPEAISEEGCSTVYTLSL